MLYEKPVGHLTGFSRIKGSKLYDGAILTCNYHIAGIREEVHADMPAWYTCFVTLSFTIAQKHPTGPTFNRPITDFIRDESPLLTHAHDRPVTNSWRCCKRYGIPRRNCKRLFWEIWSHTSFPLSLSPSRCRGLYDLMGKWCLKQHWTLSIHNLILHRMANRLLAPFVLLSHYWRGGHQAS